MQTLNELAYFKDVVKAGSSHSKCPTNTIEKYTPILPPIIIDSWKQSGFQDFSNGFLWTVNPDDWRDVAAAFFPALSKPDIHVVFRFSFGDIIFLYKNLYYHFSMFTSASHTMKPPIEAILQVDLGDLQFLKSIYFFDWHKKAVKKLGVINAEEVYGFIPALALGGSQDINNVEKVNAKAHLSFLATLLAS